MSQYIKKTDALRIVDLHYGVWSGYNEIKRLPAEDVIPVVHGYWERMPSNGIGGTGKCSQCGKSIYGYMTMKYCPNCGARMDGDDNE